jgi:hypothetical protein
MTVWGSLLIVPVFGTTRMWMQSTLLFYGIKKLFWEKISTSDNYQNLVTGFRFKFNCSTVTR